MRVDLFDFTLPADRIALYPARPRESARLLYAPADGGHADRHVGDLPDLLGAGDLLVVNDTQVIAAALSGLRASRGEGGGVGVEINLHQRMTPASWRAFARPAKRLRTGDEIAFGEGLVAVVAAKDGGEVLLEFNSAGAALDAAIGVVGAMPLPPYILAQRARVGEDSLDYQTMFAAEPGAVAAPTAGLHFTPDLVRRLEARGVGFARLTLHVGAGTFLPVKADDTDQHRMHGEWRTISAGTADAINQARREGRRIIAVGTTVLRSLESAADPHGIVTPVAGETDIFITPGYRFRVVDGLWTNFHLPRSTLVMLAAAFIGLERLQALYAHAVDAGYRFYSYGDACLFLRDRSA